MAFSHTARLDPFSSSAPTSLGPNAFVSGQAHLGNEGIQERWRYNFLPGRTPSPFRYTMRDLRSGGPNSQDTSSWTSFADPDFEVPESIHARRLSMYHPQRLRQIALHSQGSTASNRLLVRLGNLV